MRLGTVIYWMCYGVSVKYLTNRPCFTELNWIGYGTQTAAQRLLYTWAYVKESWPERPFMFVCFFAFKNECIMQLQRNKMLNSLSSIPEDAMAANLTSHRAAKGIATPLSCYMSRGRNCPHKSALSSIMLKMYKIQFGHGLLLGPSCRCKRYYLQEPISRWDSLTLRSVNILGLLVFSNNTKNGISDIRDIKRRTMACPCNVHGWRSFNVTGNGTIR